MEILRNILMPLLIPLLSLFTLLFVVCGLLWLRHEKQRAAGNGEAENARKALFIERAEAWLLSALPSIITRVENDWFSIKAKTGPIKLSAVKAELLKIVPPELLATLNAPALDNMIEFALTEARKLWKKLPSVLIENQIMGLPPTATEATVSPVVVEELQARGLHLELMDDGAIVATPDNPDAPEACEPTTAEPEADAPAEEATAPPDEEPAEE